MKKSKRSKTIFLIIFFVIIILGALFGPKFTHGQTLKNVPLVEYSLAGGNLFISSAYFDEAVVLVIRGWETYFSKDYQNTRIKEVILLTAGDYIAVTWFTLNGETKAFQFLFQVEQSTSINNSRN